MKHKIGTKGHPVLILDESSFSLWMETAPRGEWACYWKGDLGTARWGGLMIPQGRVLLARQIGNAAWAAYEARRVTLVQARDGNGFRYYAVKSVNPYPIPHKARGGRA